jgi:DNA topoisomerase-2
MASRKASEFSGHDRISHIYNVPDLYAGSAELIDRETLGYDIESMKYQNLNTKTPKVVEQIFLEILANAGDNIDRSRKAKVDPGDIKVEVKEDGYVSIQNGGLWIPIKKILPWNPQTPWTFYDEKKHKEHKFEDLHYLPVDIFGIVMTSSNYDQKVDRSGCGRNGVGSKLTNIFSKVFIVEIDDPENKKRFKAVWKDNMFMLNQSTPPEVTVVDDDSVKNGMTKITYLLDFERFKKDHYTVGDCKLFARYVFDYSFTCKVKTSFNGVEFDNRNIIDYAKSVMPDIKEGDDSNIKELETELLDDTEESKDEEIKVKYLIHYHFRDGKQRKGSPLTLAKNFSEGKGDIPLFEIMVLDTPDNSRKFSFVNGLMCPDGVHINGSMRDIYDEIIKLVGSKSKKLNISHAKNHISYIVNVMGIYNTQYASQMKTELTKCEDFKIEYMKKTLGKLKNWECIEYMKSEVDAHERSKTKRHDGKRNKLPNDKSFWDAQDAPSLDCTLYLCEGDSASTYIEALIGSLPGERKLNGYLSLRGKPLNVTNANSELYSKNKVIAKLKQVLGLKDEEDYMDDQVFKKMRYGNVIIAADSDCDGFHILLQMINTFNEKFPGIIKRGRLAFLKTPIIKVYKGKNIIHRFFKEEDFEDWKGNTTQKYDRIRYLKGLGGNNAREIEDDIKHNSVLICVHDSNCDENLKLAFHKKYSDERKAWIEKWRDQTSIEDVIDYDINDKGVNITSLVNNELVVYSLDTYHRMLPQGCDNFKESQRKLMYYALKKFTDKTVVKIEEFANAAAGETKYHHGASNLSDTVFRMAMEVMGTNNLPLFKGDGQFGNRSSDKRPAARYLEIGFRWCVKYIYYKDSLELQEKKGCVMIEGKACEPKFIPGIIPIGVVNGMSGIATAFSSKCPPHNPLDVTRWLIQRCKKVKKPNPIVPWFNGFKGKLIIVAKKIAADSKEDEIEDDTGTESEVLASSVIDTNIEMLEKSDEFKVSARTFGVYEIIKDRKKTYAHVTELPPGMYVSSYEEKINKIIDSNEPKEDKQFLKIINSSRYNNVDILIEINNDCKKRVNHKTLGLIGSHSLSNITVTDPDLRPYSAPNVNWIMHFFYKYMHNHFKDLLEEKRKISEKNMKQLEEEIRFVKLVIDGKIISKDRNKNKMSDIEPRLEKYNISKETYKKSHIYQMGDDELKKLEDELTKCIAEYDNLMKITPNEIWLERLEKLEKELEKRFKNSVLNIE